MEDSLHQNFIEKLTEHYGEWRKVVSKFGNSSFGEIADDLCISTSQFSKLISGTATEGMYTRSIKNIAQLKEYKSLRNAHTQLLEQQKNNSTERKKTLWWLWLILPIGIVLTGISYWLGKKQIESKTSDIATQNIEKLSSHPLSNFFDGDYQMNFSSPFLSPLEVQNYCPCNAYEGVWELAESYKFPLPGSKKPGIYYVAKSADIRMKCSKVDEKKGKVLLGFEKLHNEIWVDKTLTPLSPIYFDDTSKSYTDTFVNLDFENHPDFEKVADVYSFFIDEFTISSDSIVRKGEPCGRYAEVVNEELLAAFEIDVKYILNNIIGNLTSTLCEPAINENCNPNDLKAGESYINFDCFFTIKTENLGIGGGYPYTKSYRLLEQNYSDNLLCGCE
ncbi:MAG: hypothetical protein AAFP82_03225 [Bacteroidota bacterium]